MAKPYQGIMILGTPRSGTTLLRRLLDAHPHIACSAETCLFSACARFLHSQPVAENLAFGVLTGLAFAGFSADEVCARLRTLAFDFKREHAERQGKARWAEKTAVDAFYIENIEALCGEQVQFVCLVRHGLDVACSIKELSDRGYAYLAEIHEYIKRYPRPLEAFAHAWVDVNQALLGLIERHPENTIFLRYEDLIAEPEQVMRRILHFLGEPWYDNLLSAALANKEGAGLGDWKTYGKMKIDHSSMGRWQTLPPAIASALAEICNPTLQACGYDPVTVSAQRTAAQVRRRYQLALLLDSER